MVDYSQRASYLRSSLGSQVKAARAMGVSRSTFQDIEKGKTQSPTQAVKDRLNEAFTDEAPSEVLKREEEGKSIGFALSNKQTAKASQASQTYSDRGTKVAVRQTFWIQINGVGQPEPHVLYGRGDSVEEADENLNMILAKWRESNETNYAAIDIKQASSRVYRVYVSEEKW